MVISSHTDVVLFFFFIFVLHKNSYPLHLQVLVYILAYLIYSLLLISNSLLMHSKLMCVFKNE